MVLSSRLPNGRPALSLVVKRAYRWDGASLVPLRDELPLQLEPETAPSTNEGALDVLVRDSDLYAAARTQCDVLVYGSARSARGPVKMLDTGVKIGTTKKVVRVWGERTLLIDSEGRLRFSEPQPFVAIPLTWDNAYGGRDLYAEERLFPPKQGPFQRPTGPARVAYPRNGSGRGFWIDLDRERLQGARLPNLEDPEDPVTPDRLLAKTPLDWLDRPVAACYSPVGAAFFPRVASIVVPAFEPPQRPVREVTLGVLQEADLKGQDPFQPKLDPRVAQCAPPGLCANITGRIQISLWNLWPDRELWDVELPPEVPQLILQPQGCAPVELKPQLKTIVLEPDARRLELTWSGSLEVLAPYPAEMCAAMHKAVRWPERWR